MRKLTRDAGASARMASSGTTNFQYLVSSNFGRSERLIALFLPVQDDPMIVAPSFEAERVRRGAKVATVVPWEEQESPFAMARKALGAAGSGALIIEPKTEYWTAMRLAGAFAGARLADGSDLFERMRLSRAPRRSPGCSGRRRSPRMRSRPRPISSKRGCARDIADIVSKEHASRGLRGDALVQLGPQSALPHGGCTVQGYAVKCSQLLTAWVVVVRSGKGYFPEYKWCTDQAFVLPNRAGPWPPASWNAAIAGPFALESR